MPSEERVVVKTTVPRYQKAEWTEHADGLDMSQSEFVRSMVQAGRSGLEPDPSETPSPDANPGGNALETRVLETLDSTDPVEFDEIVDTITGDIESRIDEILQSLHAAGRVHHSNVDGYTLVEGAHGDD
ncbi:MAG: DUF5805 domain-containing protein [Halobacteriales archaeon]|nr:DUF5805 domain-containing protein [Halobacteriales archaeon]